MVIVAWSSSFVFASSVSSVVHYVIEDFAIFPIFREKSLQPGFIKKALAHSWERQKNESSA
jgi:hypothetical protein